VPSVKINKRAWYRIAKLAVALERNPNYRDAIELTDLVRQITRAQPEPRASTPSPVICASDIATGKPVPLNKHEVPVDHLTFGED
jgi:hypothetical protein